MSQKKINKEKTRRSEKKNQRQNEKKYYILNTMKREENEEEYLKHITAENMRKWCENNKEHLAEWRTQILIIDFWLQ
jgi:hypothetical protein